MKYLVTGAAGFIGSNVCLKLLKLGHHVTGIDVINDYYDMNLKEARLKNLLCFKDFNFFKLDISDFSTLSDLFSQYKFNRIIHLAAQAGVRYSLINPHAYTDSNLKGFVNILECSRNHNIEHLIYASSSSVYGISNQTPFSTDMPTDHPVSLYA
ncbi:MULTISPECIES: GDP-mannose 4,6-dehydratase, partial [Providencia]